MASSQQNYSKHYDKGGAHARATQPWILLHTSLLAFHTYQATFLLQIMSSDNQSSANKQSGGGEPPEKLDQSTDRTK
ncbi:hypothetical protein HYFRA_00010090 [Hymenoscyphus fraxineus]|uniref:Uncharacterized protein n=1 Tax=Hymenoscyphus fraxineus TaxID=746836 RepID=A0A9N9PNK5_9HELO|nr:hypothetical protein HYFRA_00010090 [Hymenoscyphus fraxineus]